MAVEGYVLVGGEARRFGSPKPLHPHPIYGRPLALRAAEALLEAGASRVYFVAPAERLWVARRLERLCLGRCSSLEDPPLPCRGPLRGVAAAALSRAGMIMLAPGDAAWLRPEAAGRLLDESAGLGLPSSPLYAGGLVNPLFMAAEPASLKPALDACRLRGSRARASDALRSSQPGFAAVGVSLLGEPLDFATANTPQDLERPRPPRGAVRRVEVLGVSTLFLQALAAGGLYAALAFASEAAVYRRAGLHGLAAHAERDSKSALAAAGVNLACPMV